VKHETNRHEKGSGKIAGPLLHFSESLEIRLGISDVNERLLRVETGAKFGHKISQSLIRNFRRNWTTILN